MQKFSRILLIAVFCVSGVSAVTRAQGVDYAMRTPLAKIHKEAAAEYVSIVDGSSRDYNIQNESCTGTYQAREGIGGINVIVTYRCSSKTWASTLKFSIFRLSHASPSSQIADGCDVHCQNGEKCVQTHPGDFYNMFTPLTEYKELTFESNVCRIFTRMFGRVEALRKHTLSALRERTQNPQCAPAAVKGGNADQQKAILYRLAQQPASQWGSQFKACIRSVDIQDLIRLSNTTVAKLKIEVIYPVGHETHCFSEYPLTDIANCQQTNMISAPAKSGTTRVFSFEVHI